MIYEISSRCNSSLNKTRIINTTLKWVICNNSSNINNISSNNSSKDLMIMSSIIFQVVIIMDQMQDKTMEWMMQWRNKSTVEVMETMAGIRAYQVNHRQEAPLCRIISNLWIQPNSNKMIGAQMTPMIFFRWTDWT